jgi:predicted alpha/beta superfamily hydrolase
VNGTYAVPEMMVVAIPNTNRTRDLTPTHTLKDFEGEETPMFEASGGNDAFFEFLTGELIPHIDDTYRTRNYRIFVGHSFGGITTINALYRITDTFDAYVSIDPSLWWDEQILLKQAREFFTEEDLSGKALYVAQANTLDPDNDMTNSHFASITQFDAIMEAYDESGIRYAFDYYPDDSHGSVPMIAEYDALRFIFEGFQIPIQRVISDPDGLVAHYRQVSDRMGKTFRAPHDLLQALTMVGTRRPDVPRRPLGREGQRVPGPKLLPGSAGPGRAGSRGGGEAGRVGGLGRELRPGGPRREGHRILSSPSTSTFRIFQTPSTGTRETSAS